MMHKESEKESAASGVSSYYDSEDENSVKNDSLQVFDPQRRIIDQPIMFIEIEDSRVI